MFSVTVPPNQAGETAFTCVLPACLNRSSLLGLSGSIWFELRHDKAIRCEGALFLCRLYCFFVLVVGIMGRTWLARSASSESPTGSQDHMHHRLLSCLLFEPSSTTTFSKKTSTRLAVHVILTYSYTV